MYSPENSPSRASPQSGDETGLEIPSRDGLVSLSQASDVLGFRGQELWKMLRGAGITIHRVEWDEGRGSAITLRDLFRLRQAQRPRRSPGHAPARPPAQLADVPPTHAGSAQLAPLHEHPGLTRPATARGEPEADLEPLDVSEFGADMDRLRDLVSDAQVRNEYLSVELQQLRGQMPGRVDAEADVNLAAIAAVREQAAATMADLRDQVRASAEALDEAAEAMEVERGRGRELGQTVKGLRAELVELSDSPALAEAREALVEAQGKAARVQNDLERSLSLQGRSMERLESEKRALVEQLAERAREEAERHDRILAEAQEARQALSEQQQKAARTQEGLEASLTLQGRSLESLESEKRALVEQLAEHAREEAERHDRTLAEAHEALCEQQQKAARTQEELEASLALQVRSVERMEREMAALSEKLTVREQDAQALYTSTLEEARERLAEHEQKAARTQEGLEHALTLQGHSLTRLEGERDALVEQITEREQEQQKRRATALEIAREGLREEQEKAARVQADLERSLELQVRSLARAEREKDVLAERFEARDRDDDQRDNQALNEARESVSEEREKTARAETTLERALALHERSLARTEREKQSLVEQLADQEQAGQEHRTRAQEEAREALADAQEKTNQVRTELERSRTLHGRALERMEREKQALGDRLDARDRNEVQRDTKALEDVREALSEEKERAARVQHDLERSLIFQRKSLERLEREKHVIAERIAVRDEVERNNQRYIDRLETQLKELRARRGR
ncbi:MAG: hypothetical protein ACI8QZ_001698 [Chlamydiales bacterium]|jgi:hypothetical protein